ncbi:hypothetical protein Tco_0175138 [Tanacetum coccineum]
MNSQKKLEKCIATTAFTVVADAIGKMRMYRPNFKRYGLPTWRKGVLGSGEGLVEEEERDYPWCFSSVAGFVELAAQVPHGYNSYYILSPCGSKLLALGKNNP